MQDTNEITTTKESAVDEQQFGGLFNLREQMEIARKSPRNLSLFVDNLGFMSTLSLDAASKCIFCKPVGGREIRGPSIRFAEMALSCYGHTFTARKAIEETRTHVIGQAICVDLQTGNTITMEEKRSIVGKYGRYKQSVIDNTMRSACAIAWRNAVFSIIPRALTDGPLLATQQMVIESVGDFKNEKLPRLLEYLQKKGITMQELCTYFGVDMEEEGLPKFTPENYLSLVGIGNGLREGTVSVDEWFCRKKQHAQEGSVSVDSLSKEQKDG